MKIVECFDRLQRAIDYFEKNIEGEIAETVYRFGFSGQDVFTRSFKRKVGKSPARFRHHMG